MVCVCVCVCVCVSTKQPLGCFQVLAVINSTSMNIGVHVSLKKFICMQKYKYSTILVFLKRIFINWNV